MKFKLYFTLTAILLFCLVFAVPNPLFAQRGGVDALISELDALLKKSEKSKMVTPEFLTDAKKILKKYRPVVQQKLLIDTFSDGNYTHNPTWEVLQGKFRIDGHGSLFSIVGNSDVTLQMQKGGLVPKKSLQNNEYGQLKGLMQVLSGEGKTAKSQKSVKRYVIHTAVQTPNSFDFALNFRAGIDKGQAEVGLYIDSPQKKGYRLLLSADPMVSQSISLVRYEQGSSRVLRGAGGVYLGNGLTHQIRWQRLESGLMNVWIDGIKMLQVKDPSFWNGFSGIVLANEQGEFAFDNVVLGSGKE
ncbi:MAG: hypothetical protein HQL68_07710 [Magnetococcales bacterium]|nr:hypothetical protein [Magnetococcales bacterium]